MSWLYDCISLFHYPKLHICQEFMFYRTKYPFVLYLQTKQIPTKMIKLTNNKVSVWNCESFALIFLLRHTHPTNPHTALLWMDPVPSDRRWGARKCISNARSPRRTRADAILETPFTLLTHSAVPHLQ